MPLAAGEVLESLYEHRLLSTQQIHRMHTPDSGIRWTREVLAGLRRHGLVSFLRVAEGGGCVYFLTAHGAQAVELIATRALGRRKLITSEQAAGPLRAHTLAVNETGIAFMEAAREHGDEFGAHAWQHEIAHPTGARRNELLIADALLTYLQYAPEGELIFHCRLLELDRANLPTEALAGKLARYARLYHYTPATAEGARMASTLQGIPRRHLRTRRRAPSPCLSVVRRACSRSAARTRELTQHPRGRESRSAYSATSPPKGRSPRSGSAPEISSDSNGSGTPPQDRTETIAEGSRVNPGQPTQPLRALVRLHPHTVERLAARTAELVTEHLEHSQPAGRSCRGC